MQWKLYLAPVALLSPLFLMIACGPRVARAQALMPMPSTIERGDAKVPLTTNWRIHWHGYQEPRLTRAVDRWRNHLAQRAGVQIGAAAGGEGYGLEIECRAAGAPVQKLVEDESYTLDVTAAQTKLSAPQPLGILHGLETLLQLAEREGDVAYVPAVHIDDHPRYAWRGLLLDVSRHFEPVENVKRTLDGMAAVKLNVLHWHLADDQGFRVESKLFPKLQGMGSEGQFYTQVQIREVIEYARDRGIRVVPEFDVPGHSTSWLLGYPQYGSGPMPEQLARTWGILEPTFDPTRDVTYVFFDKFFGEMTRLFPDQYFHIGGDEVNGRAWKKSKAIQRYIRVHKLKNKAGLQTYFNKRLLTILTKYNRTMVGWDEVLTPDLPKGVVIQSWRGAKALARAAEQGNRTLLSHGYYLDLMDSAAKHYLVDPLDGAAGDLTPEQQSRILGGEACMWAEYVAPQTLDSRLWPRTAAIAERFWSPASLRDVPSMYARLDRVSDELTTLGLTHESGYLPALQQLAGSNSVEPLKTLADVVEPLKHYGRGRAAREQGQPDTTQLPLNRLVDAARPESRTAREFNAAVDRYVAGDTSDARTLRDQLERWRDNDAKVQPVLAANPLLAEVVPVSHNLATLAQAGLDALDKKDIPADERRQVDDAKKPLADVGIAIAPGIDKLLGAPPAPAPAQQ